MTRTRYTAADLTREAKRAIRTTGRKSARFLRWELSIGDRAQLVAIYRHKGEAETTEHGITIAL